MWILTATGRFFLALGQPELSLTHPLHAKSEGFFAVYRQGSLEA